MHISDSSLPHRLRPLGLFGTVVGAIFALACGDPLSAKASLANQFDTLAAFSLSGTSIYAPTALNKPAEGAEAAEIVTTAQPSAQAYLQLATYAAAAGQDRKADLAGQKAIELAPKKQRSTVKQLVEQATQAAPPASTTTQPSE